MEGVTHARFDAALSELNALLDAAEQRFLAAHNFVAASVPLDEGGRLHFRRRGAEWGLFVETAGDPGNFVPIQTSTRGCRMAAAHALDALERAIGAAEEDFAMRLARAIDAAKDFVE